MTTADRIRQLRIEAGMTKTDLARALHISRPTVNGYEDGKVRPMRHLSEIAALFGVSIDYILGETDYRNAEKLADSRRRGVKIPVMGTIAAGVPITAVENIEDYEEITPEMAASGQIIGLRVKGDSMFPKIMDGDIAIIRLTEDCENGQVALVYVNDEEATLKQVKKVDGGLLLIGFNASVYSPHFYSSYEIATIPVRIGGVLLETRRTFSR